MMRNIFLSDVTMKQPVDAGGFPLSFREKLDAAGTGQPFRQGKDPGGVLSPLGGEAVAYDTAAHSRPHSFP